MGYGYVPRANSRIESARGKRLEKAYPWAWIVLSLAAVGSLYQLLYYEVLLEWRSCAPSWETISSSREQNPDNARIAIVTLADTRPSSQAAARNFRGVLDATWPNRVKFGELHGYSILNASSLLSDERPPSWSKILAVQNHLPEYTWILWMDADSIVTNMQVQLEDVLPSRSSSLDLVITKDAGGYNAGVWAIRSSAWSRDFLEQWWALSEFVRPRSPGETKSGDNDALKHLMANMDRDELHTHVGIAPQCAFNSYLWHGSLRNYFRFLLQPGAIARGMYKSGDFILHLAGIDDKFGVIKQYLAAPDRLP